MGSEQGLETEVLEAVVEPELPAGRFDERTRAALAYADAMTAGDVDDALFARVAVYFDEDALVELTATIAWENASARFNRALRIGSQGLWESTKRPGSAASPDA